MILDSLFVYDFVLMSDIPGNNFSVMSGCLPVFLGWRAVAQW